VAVRADRDSQTPSPDGIVRNWVSGRSARSWGGGRGAGPGNDRGASLEVAGPRLPLHPRRPPSAPARRVNRGAGPPILGVVRRDGGGDRTLMGPAASRRSPERPVTELKGLGPKVGRGPSSGAFRHHETSSTLLDGSNPRRWARPHPGGLDRRSAPGGTRPWSWSASSGSASRANPAGRPPEGDGHRRRQRRLPATCGVTFFNPGPGASASLPPRHQLACCSARSTRTKAASR